MRDVWRNVDWFFEHCAKYVVCAVGTERSVVASTYLFGTRVNELICNKKNLYITSLVTNETFNNIHL